VRAGTRYEYTLYSRQSACARRNRENRIGTRRTPRSELHSNADAIEVRLVAKDEEDLSMFFFYLMAVLGHATYV
jgi:hypothetical protein